jgi:hypothetical protein
MRVEGPGAKRLVRAAGVLGVPPQRLMDEAIDAYVPLAEQKAEKLDKLREQLLKDGNKQQ